MLHIILVILKIIGIILLCILGFLLLTILAVVFVPVRYDGKLSFYSKANGRFRMHWLLHIISGGIVITDNRPKLLIRILGIPVIDSTRPKKEKKRKHKKFKRKSDEETKLSEETRSEDEKSIPETNLQKEASELLESKEESAEDSKKEPVDWKEETAEDKEAENKTEEELDSVFERLKQKLLSIKNKILNIWNQIKNLFLQIKFTIISIYDKVKTGRLKWEDLLGLWGDEENQKTFGVIKSQMFEIIRHLHPRKMRIFLHFGLGSPAATGEILGWMACLMAFYQNSVQIQPDFQNQVLEGELEFKGRMRFLKFIVVGIQILKEPGFRKLLKKLR